MSYPLRLPSFAKINLWLRILGKRVDGFHELETVLQTVSLCDWLTFELCGENSINLVTSGRPLPSTRHNLVYQAADDFLRKAEIGQGVRICLKKIIPIGAGLGGGSSNAAMTLLGLNHLFDYPFSFHELEEIAGGLGSDVPFFLHGGTAFAAGRGEKIFPIEDCRPRMKPFLIFPGFQVRTKLAYSLLEFPSIEDTRLTAEERASRIRRFCELLEQQRWDSFANDLQHPVLEHHVNLKALKELLEDLGFDLVMLSGSGSALFCLGNESCRKKARHQIESRELGEYFVTRICDSAEYREILQDCWDSKPVPSEQVEECRLISSGSNDTLTPD